MDVLDVRLPPALRRCWPSRATSPSRRPRSTASRAADGAHGPHRPRRPARAAGRRRARLAPRPERAAATRSSRRTPGCRAAWRSIRRPPARTSSCGWTRSTSCPGYSWAFPAGDELRTGVGSFDPHLNVKEPTVQLADDLGIGTEGGYQGNWIPHRLRPADRRRRLLRRRQRGPLPADDRRGHPHRALLRPGLRPRAAPRGRGPPDARAGAGPLRLVQRGPPLGVRLAVARAVDRVSGINRYPAMDTTLDLMSRPRLISWAFTPLPQHRAAVVRARGRDPWAVEPWQAAGAPRSRRSPASSEPAALARVRPGAGPCASARWRWRSRRATTHSPSRIPTAIVTPSTSPGENAPSAAKNA